MYVAVNGGERRSSPLTPYRNRNAEARDGFLKSAIRLANSLIWRWTVMTEGASPTGAAALALKQASGDSVSDFVAARLSHHPAKAGGQRACRHRRYAP